MADLPEFSVRETIMPHYVLRGGLVPAGPPFEAAEPLTLDFDSVDSPLLNSELRPVLRLGVRVFMDSENCLHLQHSLREPEISTWPGGVTITRIDRTLMARGSLQHFWNLLKMLDGQQSIGEIETSVPCSRAMLSVVLLVEMLDLDDCALGQFLHMCTQKGVIPSGRLSGREIMELTVDGPRRLFPNEYAQEVHAEIPSQLIPLYELTRSRRSTLNYSGESIDWTQMEAILETACGVTGDFTWRGHRGFLRAYPSSGALYAVRIYLVALAVNGLESGIYHYAPSENVIELVRSGNLRKEFAAAAVAGQHASIRGVAAILCLVADLSRHQRKYGPGGYRMLAAESGHIAQTVILAATALGLRAGPCGGFFDALINTSLGLTERSEQFMLSVLIGRAMADG